MLYKLSEEQLKFIDENKGKLKQVEISARLGISNSAVNQRITGRKDRRRGEGISDGYFNIDKEWKHNYNV